ANTAAPYAERGGALVGLASKAREPEVRARIVEFYGVPEARVIALRAMWRSLDRTFADYFPKHLDDSDPEIRRQAVWGVGHLNIFAQAGRLQALFADDDFRADALYNYALCAPGELTRGRAKSLFGKIEKLAEELTEDETELVETAIDQRLAMQGMEPVFHGHDPEAGAPEEAKAPAPAPAPGRNDPCPCGSGKKFKKCHGQ
ncbi:MAG: SEC-C metal-binding domain-containing protein, partial [Bryobacteraceae bacterium]